MTPEELIADYLASGGEITRLPMRGPRFEQWRSNANDAKRGTARKRPYNCKPKYEVWRYKLATFPNRTR